MFSLFSEKADTEIISWYHGPLPREIYTTTCIFITHKHYWIVEILHHNRTMNAIKSKYEIAKTFVLL